MWRPNVHRRPRGVGSRFAAHDLHDSPDDSVDDRLISYLRTQTIPDEAEGCQVLRLPVRLPESLESWVRGSERHQSSIIQFLKNKPNVFQFVRPGVYAVLAPPHRSGAGSSRGSGSGGGSQDVRVLNGGTQHTDTPQPSSTVRRAVPLGGAQDDAVETMLHNPARYGIAESVFRTMPLELQLHSLLQAKVSPSERSLVLFRLQALKTQQVTPSPGTGQDSPTRQPQAVGGGPQPQRLQVSIDTRDVDKHDSGRAPGAPRAGRGTVRRVIAQGPGQRLGPGDGSSGASASVPMSQAKPFTKGAEGYSCQHCGKTGFARLAAVRQHHKDAHKGIPWQQPQQQQQQPAIDKQAKAAVPGPTEKDMGANPPTVTAVGPAKRGKVSKSGRKAGGASSRTGTSASGPLSRGAKAKAPKPKPKPKPKPAPEGQVPQLADDPASMMQRLQLVVAKAEGQELASTVAYLLECQGAERERVPYPSGGAPTGPHDGLSIPRYPVRICVLDIHSFNTNSQRSLSMRAKYGSYRAFLAHYPTLFRTGFLQVPYLQMDKHVHETPQETGKAPEAEAEGVAGHEGESNTEVPPPREAKVQPEPAREREREHEREEREVPAGGVASASTAITASQSDGDGAAAESQSQSEPHSDQSMGRGSLDSGEPPDDAGAGDAMRSASEHTVPGAVQIAVLPDETVSLVPESVPAAGEALSLCIASLMDQSLALPGAKGQRATDAEARAGEHG